MSCLIRPCLQVVANNRHVFRRVARIFAELAESLVPGHSFALRSSAEGPHKVVFAIFPLILLHALHAQITLSIESSLRGPT